MGCSTSNIGVFFTLLFLKDVWGVSESENSWWPEFPENIFEDIKREKMPILGQTCVEYGTNIARGTMDPGY